MRWLLVLTLLAAPAGVAAQEALPPPDDADVDDAEIIRWAAREVARTEGREVERRPPLPPDPYLGHGDEVVLVLPTDDDPVGRVFAELGLGALGALVGIGIGALALWAADQAGAAPDGMAIVTGLGATLTGLAVTSGVTLGAELREGRGNFGHAFLGMLLGSAAALPFIVSGLGFGLEGAALAAGGVLPLAGGVIGYEVGHANGAPRSRAPLTFP